jgi:hypothetical protein
MTIKKSLIHHWQSIPNFFTEHLTILYDVKPKAQSELSAPCSPLAIKRLIANCQLPTGRDGAVTLKSSHRMGDGQIFLKIYAPLSLMKAFRMNLQYSFSRIHLAGQQL